MPENSEKHPPYLKGNNVKLQRSVMTIILTIVFIFYNKIVPNNHEHNQMTQLAILSFIVSAHCLAVWLTTLLFCSLSVIFSCQLFSWKSTKNPTVHCWACSALNSRQIQLETSWWAQLKHLAAKQTDIYLGSWVETKNRVQNSVNIWLTYNNLPSYLLQ